jgi:hypothetical protein
MPSQPKFRQNFEQQQLIQPHISKNFQDQGKEAAKSNNNSGLENQQNQGQWGEDRANADQNLTEANNPPVNQSGREVPMQDDTPRNYPERGDQQLS